ncbi:MAG: hypothetical protein QOJ58_5433 [Alphaproteobacteria bacterium]|jgi:hypothetical protein|nr:hypothetical protein [Alphaproteobacteria bacterium]
MPCPSFHSRTMQSLRSIMITRNVEQLCADAIGVVLEMGLPPDIRLAASQRMNAEPRRWFLCRTSDRSRHLAYTKPDPALPKIGARLELTRRALDLTRFQMARLLGTDVAMWGTYEAGLARIPAEQALKLSPYGIPLDWIYQGRTTDLHPHIRAKIRQLAK